MRRRSAGGDGGGDDDECTECETLTLWEPAFAVHPDGNEIIWNNYTHHLESSRCRVLIPVHSTTLNLPANPIPAHLGLFIYSEESLLVALSLSCLLFREREDHEEIKTSKIDWMNTNNIFLQSNIYARSSEIVVLLFFFFFLSCPLDSIFFPHCRNCCGFSFVNMKIKEYTQWVGGGGGTKNTMKDFR